MYKCLECGHIFDDGEQGIVVEHHPYGSTTAAERLSVCPVCGGGYEETTYCQKCGGEFLDSELTADFCDECLRDLLTPENFLVFASTGVDDPEDVDTLEDFIFTEVFGLQEAPETSTEALKEWCKKILNLASTTPGFNDKLSAYMDSFALWTDFAYFLDEKGVKE